MPLQPGAPQAPRAPLSSGAHERAGFWLERAHTSPPHACFPSTASHQAALPTANFAAHYKYQPPQSSARRAWGREGRRHGGCASAPGPLCAARCDLVIFSSPCRAPIGASHLLLRVTAPSTFSSPFSASAAAPVHTTWSHANPKAASVTVQASQGGGGARQPGPRAARRAAARPRARYVCKCEGSGVQGAPGASGARAGRQGRARRCRTPVPRSGGGRHTD
ncbi:MAG: hypothetical protein J3K34DRAFT_21847 [Monoraphidium minutum]|nr:MAG: hypothetical protein J3K34DRAFT_21847 [Monoraphidium minutum]